MLSWKVEDLTSKGKLPAWKGVHGCAYSGYSAPDDGRGPCLPCLLHSLLLCTLRDSCQEVVLARLCALNHCSMLPRRWSGEVGEERLGAVPPAAPNFTWEMVPLQALSRNQRSWGLMISTLAGHFRRPFQLTAMKIFDCFPLISISYIKLSLLTVFSPQMFS